MEKQSNLDTTTEWQDYNIVDKFKHLMEHGNMSDCSFKIGPKVFHTHKTILGMCSPVFERMFYGEFRESNASDEILLTDTEASDFENLLYFVYTQKTDKLVMLNIESLRSLIYLSKKYMTTKLTEACFEMIEHKLLEEQKTTISEVLNVFELGHLLCHERLIQLSTEQFGKRVFDIKTCFFVYDLSDCIFMELLKTLKDRISELERFQIIEKYIKMNAAQEDLHFIDQEQSETKELETKFATDLQIDEDDKNNHMINIKNPNCALNRKMINDMLNQLDFTKLTAKEYVDGPGESLLFNDFQKLSHLKLIIRGNGPKPFDIPDTLMLNCQNRRKTIQAFKFRKLDPNTLNNSD